MIKLNQLNKEANYWLLLMGSYFGAGGTFLHSQTPIKVHLNIFTGKFINTQCPFVSDKN